MFEIAKRLEFYIDSHPFNLDDSDYATILDQLFSAYQDSHEWDSPKMRNSFCELDELLGKLPLENNNEVFSLCCSLCVAYEHETSIDGMQYGANLILELRTI